ncbi:Ig-like domain-containing protein [Paenibacillus sp. KQZ6P-2]|uniref:Ig-like domain-containing protein n=1 Tax=Paenibacillus mangrovi TaxID=2931978 RepID=A0A9X2B4K3_9BACL|nr:Ig-like domain-containing protein [Paenibacillus mangrovi]MCJ8014729.1 Ig-like domain-containing protein [Paenibacillus mangrovi]
MVAHAVNSKVSAMIVLLLLIGYLTPVGAPLKAQAAPGYQQYPDMNGVFGWDGDKDAPIAYIDGSFKIRDGKNITVTFGIHDGEPVKWYNDESYLPNLVSEFEKNDLSVKIMNFGDKVTLNGKDYVIAYSRVSITNPTSENKELSPTPSPQLITLNSPNKQVKPKETVHYDYAIAVDRFGHKYDWPSNEDIKNAGSWDDHYAHMKDYWEKRVSAIAQIESLPDPRLIDAYKAGFIYTHIIKDGYELHVGENGYDEMWDHDTIGILSTLFTIGDFTDAQQFLSTLPAQLQYDDAKWKYSWPWALYLVRTGDKEFVKKNFSEIKKNTHFIESDRTGPDGIMKETMAIDSRGYWTIDNWAGLMGLLSYKYICEQLGEKAEEKWAEDLYDDFLDTVNKKLSETIVKYDLDYIPISMVEPNDANRAREPRDGNWASMFLFGRWAWDGYLFGGKQEGIMLDWIDKTYDYGFSRLKGLLPPHNFGGYPHGIFSSSYNAGYGSAGLRGEKYRSEGIKAYQFMIDQTMSAPYSWWEGISYPDPNQIWDIPHTPGGGGSSPHMWGQSTATKVLFDSLIAEKIDGNVIIGRGVPEEWLVHSAAPIEISNYPISDKRRMGYKIESTGKEVTLTLTGDSPSGEVWFNLPFFKNNIESANAGTVDNDAGLITLPSGTTSVTVKLKKAAQSIQAPKLTKAEASANTANLEWTSVDQADGYTVKYGTRPGEYPHEIDAKTATTITVDGLEPMQDYYFIVTARKAGKESEYSNFLGIRTDLPLPVEGGLLDGSQQSPSGQLSVNLTEEGKLDWIHAGGIGINNEIRFNRKSNGNEQIKYSVKGSSSASAFGDSRVVTSWTDGVPGEKAVNNTTGLFYSGIGNGWQLVVPAGTTEKTLKIYTSVWNSKAKLEAYLSDNSAVLYSDVNERAGDSSYKVYTLKFKAKSEGQTLTVKNISQSANGNVTFIAATLSGASDQEVKVTGIRLSDQEVTLKKGESYQVQAYVQPAEATNKEVTWQSDNPQVVTVTNGVLEGKTSGSALVTATTKDGGFSERVRVTVTDEEQQEGLTIHTSFNMDALEGGKLLAAEVKIKNGLQHPEQVLVIAALYDGNGKMVSISYVSRNIAAGETDTLIPGIKLPQQINNHKVKVMVWDGKNMNATKMQPLADVAIK